MTNYTYTVTFATDNIVVTVTIGSNAIEDEKVILEAIDHLSEEHGIDVSMYHEAEVAN